MLGLVAVLLVFFFSICESVTIIIQIEGVNVLWKNQEVCRNIWSIAWSTSL